MEFRMEITDGKSTWFEDEIRNVPDAQEEAERILNDFNNTLRRGELPRKLIGVKIINQDKRNHAWIKRTDGMSVNFRGGTVDLMYCQKCGITGKRSGLSANVKRDSKYRAKKYEFCRPVGSV